MTIVPTWPESRFITLDGIRRHYVTLGSRGPAVVFLHGYADSWRSFEPLLPAFSKGFRVIALDQRGHGMTSVTSDYEIADFTRDAIAFLEAVALEPVHLVGHSLGSIVAQRVAESRPELLRSISLIGAAPTASGNRTLTAVRGELLELGDRITDDFIEAFQAGGLEGPLREERLRTLVRESRRLLPRTWHGALEGLLTEPEPPQATIRTPALSVWGARDGIFDRGAQVALARAIPHLEAVHYPGVGHAPHWEIPDQVATEVVSFIQSIESDASIHAWQDGLYAD